MLATIVKIFLVILLIAAAWFGFKMIFGNK